MSSTIKIEKDFLDKKTCNQLIDKFEQLKSKTFKFRKRDVLRCNDIQDDVLINWLRDKLNTYFKDKLDKGAFQRNLEIVFWQEGEEHDEHVDTPFYDTTCIINLNDSFEGGRTSVQYNEVEPKTGQLIYFNASIPHSVSELTKGERYVILVWYNNKHNTN